MACDQDDRATKCPWPPTLPEQAALWRELGRTLDGHGDPQRNMLLSRFEFIIPDDLSGLFWEFVNQPFQYFQLRRTSSPADLGQ